METLGSKNPSRLDYKTLFRDITIAIKENNTAYLNDLYLNYDLSENQMQFIELAERQINKALKSEG